MDQLRSASLKLMQPLVMRAWTTWIDFWDMRRHMIRQIRLAAHNLTMSSEIAAFRMWRDSTTFASDAAADGNENPCEALLRCLGGGGAPPKQLTLSDRLRSEIDRREDDTHQYV